MAPKTLFLTQITLMHIFIYAKLQKEFIKHFQSRFFSTNLKFASKYFKGVVDCDFTFLTLVSV